MKDIYKITKEGKKKFEEELKELIEVKIPENVKELKAAREQGDLSENAEYDTARTI